MREGDGMSKMTKFIRSLILGNAIMCGALLAVVFISNHSLAERIMVTLSVFFFSWLYVITEPEDSLNK